MSRRFGSWVRRQHVCENLGVAVALAQAGAPLQRGPDTDEALIHAAMRRIMLLRRVAARRAPPARASCLCTRSGSDLTPADVSFDRARTIQQRRLLHQSQAA